MIVTTGWDDLNLATISNPNWRLIDVRIKEICNLLDQGDFRQAHVLTSLVKEVFEIDMEWIHPDGGDDRDLTASELDDQIVELARMFPNLSRPELRQAVNVGHGDLNLSKEWLSKVGRH